MKRSGFTLYSCDQCKHQEMISKDTPAMNWIETVITYNPMFVEQGNEKQYVTINNTKQFCGSNCLKKFILNQEALQKNRDKANNNIGTTIMNELSSVQGEFEKLEAEVQQKLTVIRYEDLK